jgi:sec-independent protein translocase protein TatA
MLLFLNLGGGEIIIIMLFVLMFFGADKIPELARGLGRGMREFKDAANEIQREIENGSRDVKKQISLDQDYDEVVEKVKKEVADNVTETPTIATVEAPKEEIKPITVGGITIAPPNESAAR